MKPRISLRINGSRVGDTARPTESTVERMPTRKAVAPARAALSTRPNDYMAGLIEDDEAS